MTDSALIAAARQLSSEVSRLRFSLPVTHVYNPLDYAWAPHEAYLRRFGTATGRVVFLGMNPGPYGMMQTGVPFGEVAAVRDWMGIHEPVARPASEHPKRPIEGFACTRSEVSGRRLWGWAQARFGSAPAFFERGFVLNYCPLVFLEASGRNFTPDKLPAAEAAALRHACDAHLVRALLALAPAWAIGVGGFALKRLQAVSQTPPDELSAPELARLAAMRIGQILHPSPASPAANRGWPQAVDSALSQLGVFE
ncbi:MAG: single-stranded DNA-binding protein [Burkholderiaceae bacterium]|nr:single-stranded DNA-binding protein [Burkholderiaceae bacterium]